MASSKGINIKVTREKLIEALESRLSELESTRKQYDQDVKNYKQAKKDWLESLFKIASKTPELRTELEQGHLYGRGADGYRLQVEYFIPKNAVSDEPTEPKNPLEDKWVGRYRYNYEDQVFEMNNAIRMLKLSDEDVVSTATYASVSRYL